MQNPEDEKSSIFESRKSNLETANSASSNFDILKFWKNEIERVNQTDLNIEYKENSTLKYKNPYTGKQYEFKKQRITFYSPNWVGESPNSLRLKGYLLYPENLKYSNSANPGCLCMHGLNGNVNDSIRLAYQYLEEDFIVLIYDHPGHGESEGAKPAPSNFYFEGDFNKTSHNYLTICGAIQGLRLLENQSIINNSQIMVTGSSYGGLNTMWLSGICGNRIAGVLPYIAVGDLKKVLDFPNKLFFWVWSKSPSEIPQDFWDNQNLRFDPIYYLKSPSTPPILWQFGTTDEFFPYTCINSTLEAVPHNRKFLQIFPNRHHGFEGYQNTTKYFIDYIINDGPSPPNITLKKRYEKEMKVLGDSLKVQLDVDSAKKISKVEVCYKYLDIVGARWEKKKMEQTKDNDWEATLTATLLNSKLDYYFIFTLEGQEQVWFSSKIYTGGLFRSNFHVLFLPIVIGLIGLIVLYLLHRRYKNDVKQQPEELQNKAKKMLSREYVLLGISETLFLISPLLPWAIIDDGVITWTHIYLFNNIYTSDAIFGILASIITYSFIVSWITFAITSIMKPILSGLLRIWYPVVALIIIGMLTNLLFSTETAGGNFGLGYAGIGVYLMLFSNIFVIIVGIWKRKYQADLGIRETKNRNWYNIDRWFRIR